MNEQEFAVEYNNETYTARRKWDIAYWVVEVYNADGAPVLRICTVDEPTNWEDFVIQALSINSVSMPDIFEIAEQI